MAITYTYTSPVPGITPGTQWAQDLNDFASNVKGHNHTGTDEVKVTPGGLNINSALSFGSNPATALSWTQYTPAAYASGTQYRVFVNASGNLYYENASGVQVQITNGNTIFIPGAAPGTGFTGDYYASAPTYIGRADYKSTVTTSQPQPLYRFYTGGGTNTANLLAGAHIADVPSRVYSQYERPFMMSDFSMGLDKDGFRWNNGGALSAFSGNPWLGFVTLNYDGNRQKGLQVGTDIKNDDRFKFWVAAKTENATNPNAAHSAFYWSNTTGSGSYGPSSGYAIQFLSEYTVSGALDSAPMAQIRPWWRAVGADLAGGLTFYASGNGGRQNGLFEITAATTTAAPYAFFTGSGGTPPYANVFPTFFIQADVIPQANIAHDLGSGSYYWRSLYTNAIYANSVETVVSFNAGSSTSAGIIATNSPLISSVVNSPSSAIQKGGVYKNNQIVSWGFIDNSGSLNSGFNATVSKISTGVYDITFPTAMASATSYAVILTPDDAGGTKKPLAWVSTRSASTVRVLVWSTDTASLTDLSLHFMIVGS